MGLVVFLWIFQRGQRCLVAGASWLRPHQLHHVESVSGSLLDRVPPDPRRRRFLTKALFSTLTRLSSTMMPHGPLQNKETLSFNFFFETLPPRGGRWVSILGEEKELPTPRLEGLIASFFANADDVQGLSQRGPARASEESGDTLHHQQIHGPEIPIPSSRPRSQGRSELESILPLRHQILTPPPLLNCLHSDPDIANTQHQSNVPSCVSNWVGAISTECLQRSHCPELQDLPPVHPEMSLNNTGIPGNFCCNSDTCFRRRITSDSTSSWRALGWRLQVCFHLQSGQPCLVLATSSSQFMTCLGLLELFRASLKKYTHPLACSTARAKKSFKTSFSAPDFV